MREDTYPASYEAHLRRRVKELEEQNEKLRNLVLGLNALDMGNYYSVDMKAHDELMVEVLRFHSPTT